MEVRNTPISRKPGGPRPVPNLEMLKLRMQRGLSREDLGALAGVSEKQIGLIERGVARHSRAATLANIANALEADVLTVFPIERRMR